MSGQARPRLVRRVSLIALMFGAAFAAPAQGSISIGTAATHATLQVDARGDVLVTWTQAGVAQTVFVSAQGVLTRSGALAGPDIARPAQVPGLAGAVVTRRGAGGSLWALQLISLGAGNAPSLDLSHWHGSPPMLHVSVAGARLTGSVSFHGRPVSGESETPGGRRPKIYVYLDCYRCGGRLGWSPMLGVAPTSGGTFSVRLRSGWVGTRYRASVQGPNAGTTYAPDAQVIVG